MIRALARAASGRRSKWVVIAVWVGLLVAFSPASMTLSDVTTDETATADSLPEDSESARFGASRASGGSSRRSDRGRHRAWCRATGRSRSWPCR